MTKVSIILPNYNHAKFLQQRIDSILNQSYQDFELIVLDDFSTDISRDILNALKTHPKVSHVVYNNTNCGNTFKQWEKGLMLATGELIWIAESDDSIDSTFLEKAIVHFQENSSIGIVQCGSEWISETGSFIYEDTFDIKTHEINGQSFIIDNMMTGNSLYNASAILFKRSFITLPLNKSILELKYCGDWLFWIKILEKSNLFILYENLNKFRRHSHTVSNNADKNGIFYLEGIKIYNYIKTKYPKSDKYYNYDQYWATNILLKEYSYNILLKFLFKASFTSPMIPIYMFINAIKNSLKRKLVQFKKVATSNN